MKTTKTQSAWRDRRGAEEVRPTAAKFDSLILSGDAPRTVAGYYDVKTKTVNLLNWLTPSNRSRCGARVDARAPGPVVRHREVDERIFGKD